MSWMGRRIGKTAGPVPRSDGQEGKEGEAYLVVWIVGSVIEDGPSLAPRTGSDDPKPLGPSAQPARRKALPPARVCDLTVLRPLGAA